MQTWFTHELSFRPLSPAPSFSDSFLRCCWWSSPGSSATSYLIPSGDVWADLVNPCGSLTQKDPQLQPWHGVHCSWLCVQGDSCRAVLSSPITGMNISPPADLRNLLWQCWGRWQGWLHSDTPEWGWSCCAWCLPSEPGHAPCLTDRVYWNCRGMLIALRLQLQCLAVLTGNIQGQAGL